ncbi:MAG: holo-ACP synthase [candidate division Zixibacteria bacterium]
MTESIGIDLVETNRIRKILKKHGARFVNRILSQRELVTYAQRGDKVNFLAGRFAAKEAVIKSLGRYLTERPAYSSLEIVNDETGNPYLDFGGLTGEKLGHKKCLISISHEKHYAAAVAIITAGK